MKNMDHKQTMKTRGVTVIFAAMNKNVEKILRAQQVVTDDDVMLPHHDDGLSADWHGGLMLPHGAHGQCVQQSVYISFLGMVALLECKTCLMNPCPAV